MCNNQPLACNLNAIDDDEKATHKSNAEEVFASVEVCQELSDGYGFRLPTKTEMIKKAGAFIARERQCCPFFKFTLEITPDNGPAWLKLTGNDEVMEYIKQNVIPQLNISDNNCWQLTDNTICQFNTLGFSVLSGTLISFLIPSVLLTQYSTSGYRSISPTPPLDNCHRRNSLSQKLNDFPIWLTHLVEI